MTMGLLFRGHAEYGGETIIISDDVTDMDTEYVGIIIKEENVPTGYNEDFCIVHVIMIAITVAFTIYNVVRVIQRSKVKQGEADSLTDTN